MSLVSSTVLKATANRSQDAEYYANQQALLQKQLAELTLRAQNFGAETLEASEGLRKKRLKLHQEVEVGLNPTVSVLWPFTCVPLCTYQPQGSPFCLCMHATLVQSMESLPARFLQSRLHPTCPGFHLPTRYKKGFVYCEGRISLAVLHFLTCRLDGLASEAACVILSLCVACK